MQTKQKHTSLVWFRNDLRVRDNEALTHASENSDRLIAIYCFDPRHFETDRFGFKKTERFRARFLIETVKALYNSLKKLNITLIVEYDKPEDVLAKVCEQYQVNRLYFQKEWTQEEREVQEMVLKSLPEEIVVNSFYGQFLYHPDDLPIELENLQKIFTGFRKMVEKKSVVRDEFKPIAMPPENKLERSITFPSLNDLGLEEFKQPKHTAFPFKGGEKSALERVDDYFFQTKKLGFYKKTRNGLLGTDYSSKFSPWLANGSISARTIYWEVKRFESTHFKNQSTYWLIFELIWRDYFKYVSLKHGDDIFKIGGILKRDYDWLSKEKFVNEWIEGRTVSDFVNANMIELGRTGWMSNRGRQNVASFFAKNQKLDWRIGAAYFESMLLDYDVHSNYGNWMYVAGVGNDPRDRVFNVDSQAERYDADGRYRRRWLQTQLQF